MFLSENLENMVPWNDTAGEHSSVLGIFAACSAAKHNHVAHIAVRFLCKRRRLHPGPRAGTRTSTRNRSNIYRGCTQEKVNI